MFKLNAAFIKKAALGFAFVVLAAFLAAVINNALAQQNPENQLPALRVSYNIETGDYLPQDYVKRDAYKWQFMFWQHSGGGKDLEIWRSVRPAPVPPNSAMALDFNIPIKDITVSVLVGGGEFERIGGTLYTPQITNVEHNYKVDAVFGDNQEVTYYFSLIATV